MMKREYWTSFGGGLVFANLWCLANAILTIVMPILTMIITYRYNKNMMIDNAYRKKYKFIFEEIKADKQPAHLMIILFIVRRYFLVSFLIAFPKKWYFQIVLTFLAQTVYLSYVIHSKPYEIPAQNYSDLFNEFTVMSSAYFLFLFTDIVDD